MPLFERDWAAEQRAKNAERKAKDDAFQRQMERKAAEDAARRRQQENR